MSIFSKLSLGKPLFFLIAVLLFSCSIFEEKKSTNTESIYGIYTEFGLIKVKLYDQTPKHKANFEKLVQEGYYDSTLFHRVINNFMIQGGDPESKNAPKGKQLGSGGPGYTVPAEISDTLYHFKGALAAARQGDQVNPERASSGSQFYIVHGQEVKDAMLNQIENRINQQKQQQVTGKLFNDSNNIKLKEKILYFRQINNKDSFDIYVNKLNQLAAEELDGKGFEYSDSARAKYKRIGGTPHLDANYTVFGEVIEGLNIIDSIANVQTERGDRPKKDIIMTIKKID